MKIMKKIILGLSIMIAFSLALVIGCVGKSESSTPSVINNESVKIDTNNSITYDFEPGEVVIQKGSGNIDYAYNPSVNSRQGASVAYEYQFNNPASNTQAVNLKRIDSTDVTLSYKVSTTKLDEITSTDSKLDTTPLAPNTTVYIYLVVTPTNSEIPTTFQSNVIWNQGTLATINVYNSETNSTTTLNVIKGQLVKDIVISSSIAGYELEGLYSDANYNTEVSDTTRVEGDITYYTKFPTLPTDWLDYDTAEGKYYVKKR